MCEVHPCNWSLLPSSVFSMFTCVLFHHTCSDTCAQVFQESPGVPLTPQLVLSLQDCCDFQLVPLYTASMVEATSRCMWLPPMPNICHAHHNFGISGWVPTKAVQPKTQVETHSVVTQVCKCGCGKVRSDQMLSCTNGFTSGHRH